MVWPKVLARGRTLQKVVVQEPAKDVSVIKRRRKTSRGTLEGLINKLDIRRPTLVDGSLYYRFRRMR